jgi:hypothetical protein
MPRLTSGITLGLMFGLAAGCNQQTGDFKTAKQINEGKKAAGQPHEHESEGPHGGAIVELGDEEYHAEVVIDPKTYTLSVYLLGKDAKTATPIAAEEVTVVTEDDSKLKLKAVPQDGESGGKASKFELAEEATVGPIAKAGFLHGALKLEIDGKPYGGDIDLHFDGSSHDDGKDEPKKDDSEAPSKPASGD